MSFPIDYFILGMVCFYAGILVGVYANGNEKN